MRWRIAVPIGAWNQEPGEGSGTGCWLYRVPCRCLAEALERTLADAKKVPRMCPCGCLAGAQVVTAGGLPGCPAVDSRGREGGIGWRWVCQRGNGFLL